MHYKHSSLTLVSGIYKKKICTAVINTEKTPYWSKLLFLLSDCSVILSDSSETAIEPTM